MADSTETRKDRRASARAERVERERADAARARQRRRIWQLGGAVLVAVVVVVAIVVATGGGGSTKPKLQAGENVPGQRDAAALFAGVPQSGITVGRANAPYTMIEFADLQCPFCKQYTDEAEPSVINQFVRTGRLRIEFRNLTIIGTDSIRAAQMAEAAGLQNRLWNYADLFYANQGTENTGYVTDAFLRRIGSGVPGLDVERAMSQRADASVQRRLADATALATRYGVSATPTFVVGRTGGTLRALNLTALDANTVTGAIGQIVK
jgi:protein-disulfide isomerase